MNKKGIAMGIFILIAGLFIGVMKIYIDSQQKDATNNSNTHTTETSESAPIQERVDSLMEKMTLEEKVGQLFFVRTPDIEAIEDIKTYHLGGYVLFGRDTDDETAASLKEKIRKFQQASKIPMLIGADEEGGLVTRISRNASLVDARFQSPQALYQAGGLEAIKADTEEKAKILHNYGIHTGLFPVADVSMNPNSFIYDRTIGLDAAGTSEYVEATVEVLKENRIGSTLKHFPGYGENQDSHVGIVTDNRPLAELRASDFLPFKAGIEAGADSVLLSHNIISSIDPNAPASISSAIHDVLREELGFTGVIMTDDMDMAGLSDFISQEEAGLRALQAGNDLVMSSSYQDQIPYVIEAIKRGEYSEAALDNSVRRVLNWKKDLRLF